MILVLCLLHFLYFLDFSLLVFGVDTEGAGFVEGEIEGLGFLDEDVAKLFFLGEGDGL